MAMGMTREYKFYFFSLAVSGIGISGSDRIFIELARNWGRKHLVDIFTSCEGKRLCKKQELRGKNLKIKSINNKPFEHFFLLNYFYKIFSGIILGITFKILQKDIVRTYLYPASDFWMDVFPCVLLKIRYPKLKWIATWYQTAPSPFQGFAEGERGERYRFSSFLYWFSQTPIKPLIAMFADKVIVNNEDEKRRFPKLTMRGDTIVLIGAVRLDEIKDYLTKVKGQKSKVYDAVFQGRFHPQKGVVELIDVWRKVVDKLPSAKLAMIGDGPLMGDVVSRIAQHELQENIKLFGYVFDGPKKYKIFSQSKMVVHPAFYDSGGMASAEAMAFGIPAVGFNLKAYKSYYPEGMVKVSVGDIEGFAKEIIHLLENEKARNIIGKKAKRTIQDNWSWSKRASETLQRIYE